MLCFTLPLSRRFAPTRSYRRLSSCAWCLPALLLALTAPHAIAEQPVSGTPGTVARAPQTITSPMGKTLNLVWHDEFDAVKDKDGKPYIDRSKWQTTFWQGSSERTLFGNVEAEYYMDKDYNGDSWIHPEANGRFNPFSFEKPGILTISATKVPQELWRKFYMGDQRPFSSGLLISDGRFAYQYGYVEGRFKLPNNRGAWPAFWLLGDDPNVPLPNEAHQWGPEVDVFEFFGHRPMKHSAGIHGRDGDKASFTFGYHEAGIDLTQDYHIWGFEWDSHECVWTMDGKVWARGNTPASLNRPMYLLINLAVGGQWYSQEMDAAHTPHKPWDVDEAGMPWKMLCDYVRVYRAPELDKQAADWRAQDRAANNHLTREVWLKAPGGLVSDIPLDKKPTAVTYLSSFEASPNGWMQYGSRVRGYVTPPTTGLYTFWIAGDDNAELWLGTDDTAAARVRRAFVAGKGLFTGEREWNKFPTQKSEPVMLQAGRRYYIEALLKQDVGGDNLSVGWLKPGQTGAVPSEVIPSSVLTPYQK